MKNILFAVLLVFSACYSQASDLTDFLQKSSVTVLTDHGSGSGTLKIRNGVYYVWTAGHVVSSCRHVTTIIDEKGVSSEVVTFDEVSVVRDIVIDGVQIDGLVSKAEIIKYSGAENGHDLCILRLKSKDFFGCSTNFYLDKNIPSNGTELYHVGSLLGPMGSCSLTTGIISHVGRMIHGVLFDQTSVTAFPGSSGGGVFLKSDGRYIGMLVRAAGETFNVVVPVRRMSAWAKANNAEWAMDDSVPVPTNFGDIENSSEKDSVIPGSSTKTIIMVPSKPLSTSP